MRKFFLLLVFGFWLSFVGCAKKLVKIGVVLPLSGALSSYGDMCLKGIKLAEKAINDKGGIKGRLVEIIVEDNKGEAEASEFVVEKLDKEGVIAIIGPLTTENVISISVYADEAKLPIITPTATGIDATKDKKWVFRVSFTDPFQGSMLAKFAREELEVKSACVFINPRDSYSTGLAESFERKFKELGGKILSEATFEANATDFSSQLKAIRRENPECIFVPAFYPEAGLIIKQARGMGFKIPFLGGDGWDSPELAKIIGNRQGVNFYSTHFFYNYKGHEVEEFLHKFRLEYGREPETFSALGYDAVRLIQENFEHSRRITRKDFGYNIRKTKFLGVTGTIDFIKAKDPRRSLMILMFATGKPIEVVGTY
ncbi:ABC transporter substrate-binding protein [candidate division WOR-3 bacterium]|nr:ABC transporter substrate-binding protein [candidate division WOR-3 bacterium]